MDLQKKFRGAILGLAIGDALGWPVEFIRTREGILAATDGKGVTDLPTPALFTDDTQMTICVAEALLEGDKDVDAFMTSLTKRFIEWYKMQSDKEKCRAPGTTCMMACENLIAGKNWENSGVPESLGCGSAMRSAPIGLYHTQTEIVVDFAINSSRITHPNELAMSAAVGNAIVTRWAMEDVPVGMWANDLLRVASINKDFTSKIQQAAEQAAKKAPPDYVLSKQCLGEGWTGHEAIASALYCAMMNPDSYKDAVLMAANAVGDSDSIACIVGGWMGARLEVDAIPKEWVDKIEDRDGLIKLADRLFIYAY